MVAICLRLNSGSVSRRKCSDPRHDNDDVAVGSKRDAKEPESQTGTIGIQ